MTTKGQTGLERWKELELLMAEEENPESYLVLLREYDGIVKDLAKRRYYLEEKIQEMTAEYESIWIPKTDWLRKYTLLVLKDLTGE